MLMAKPKSCQSPPYCSNIVNYTTLAIAIAAERLPLLIKQQLYVDRVPQKLPLKEIFPHNHCHGSQSHYSIFFQSYAMLTQGIQMNIEYGLN